MLVTIMRRNLVIFLFIVTTVFVLLRVYILFPNILEYINPNAVILVVTVALMITTIAAIDDTIKFFKKNNKK